MVTAVYPCHLVLPRKMSDESSELRALVWSEGGFETLILRWWVAGELLGSLYLSTLDMGGERESGQTDSNANVNANYTCWYIRTVFCPSKDERAPPMDHAMKYAWSMKLMRRRMIRTNHCSSGRSLHRVAQAGILEILLHLFWITQ